MSDKTAFFNQAIALCDELSMTLRSSNRSEYAGLALTVGLVRGELDRQRMWETAQDQIMRMTKNQGVVMGHGGGNRGRKLRTDPNTQTEASK